MTLPPSKGADPSIEMVTGPGGLPCAGRARVPAPRLAAFTAVLLACTVLVHPSAGQATSDDRELFARTFDTHWERLRDDYPYFDLYGIDWNAERAEHRERAITAKDPTHFAWELARLISALPDPHVSFTPSIETMKGHWSFPEVQTRMIGRRRFVIAWPEAQRPVAPPDHAEDPRAYPEVIAVQGESPLGAAEILAAGPVGTTFGIRLRWPDGSETDHEMRRPDESNIPPPPGHFGKSWLVTGRIGSIGYMRVKTFDPELATLGPDGKMTTMLRAALAELHDTEGLVLDLQGNSGGLVAASDPFLGHFLEKSRGYRWGNSGGRRRVIRPGKPQYRGNVVVIVDDRSASGAEWAARILRDAGRATVVGGRTAGAEAAVHTSKGPDGSVVKYSAWPMIEPGVTPFQARGIEVDHALPLTIEDARAHGIDEALKLVRRARYGKALELLGAPAASLDALITLADDADRSDDEPTHDER